MNIYGTSTSNFYKKNHSTVACIVLIGCTFCADIYWLIIVTGTKRPHTASVIINVGETATFDVAFQPKLAQRSAAHVRLTVVNNQYEDSVIQLIGEGYEDDITIDNIHDVIIPVDPELEEGSMAEEDVPGGDIGKKYSYLRKSLLSMSLELMRLCGNVDITSKICQCLCQYVS